jgi:hypothetical protein
MLEFIAEREAVLTDAVEEEWLGRRGARGSVVWRGIEAR